MIDDATLVRWKALADKALDDGSTEPERAASARALAKEIAKILASPSRQAMATRFCRNCGTGPLADDWELDLCFFCQAASPSTFSPTHAHDPSRCGACNHPADSHTAHVRNGTCYECTLHGKTCTVTRNEILGQRSRAAEPHFGQGFQGRKR
jgi:hypothetical protein